MNPLRLGEVNHPRCSDDRCVPNDGCSPTASGREAALSPHAWAAGGPEPVRPDILLATWVVGPRYFQECCSGEHCIYYEHICVELSQWQPAFIFSLKTNCVGVSHYMWRPHARRIDIYIYMLRKGIPVPKDDTHKSCVPHLDPLRDQKSSRMVAELRRAFR